MIPVVTMVKMRDKKTPPKVWWWDGDTLATTKANDVTVITQADG